MLWWSCRSLLAHSCSLLSHLSSFCRGMFKLNTECDADLLLYLLSHLECDSHTLHMLTAPLTGTVKSSLFMHAHSSPLSLAARLYQCRANHSRYISDGWTSPGQTSSYIHIYTIFRYSYQLLLYIFKAKLLDANMFGIIMYKVCPEGIQPCNMKNRDIYFKRYKRHCTYRTMTP